MKKQWFVLSAIAAIAMIGMFVFENTAAAHREVQSKRQYRNDNTRPTRGRIATLNPVATLNQSWIDLTFGVTVDTETLAKVHPIYQKTRETLQTQIKEARKSDEKREAVKKLRENIKETNAKFYASLKEVLTEEQMTKLTELTKKRRTDARKRVNELRRNQLESRRHR
ncbi:hypothetical protein J4G07_18140 [Candidatus Poribacteria bacterium]|nr:hypothetical protein [Candidatus Poribacteria bacterium]